MNARKYLKPYLSVQMDPLDQAREERERLQREIQSLLDQQRELNAQLASAIGSLDTVVDKMNQGKEEV